MNAAEIIIDNFIVSAETKWGTQSGIVVVLPHGMDGQGPEHSQARIERLLDLSDDACDEDQSTNYQNQMRYCNIQVVNCTNGANYFHVLRRQIHRDYRKPLFCFNSKKVLKYKPVSHSLFRLLNFSPLLRKEQIFNQSILTLSTRPKSRRCSSLADSSTGTFWREGVN